MAIILLIAYAVIMTILFICALIGVSTRIQDDACIIRNDRIVVKDFISQLTEAQGRVSALEAENCKLKEVISQQDKDLDACHKLLELQNQANSQLSTLNSQLGAALSTLNFPLRLCLFLPAPSSPAAVPASARSRSALRCAGRRSVRSCRR